MYFCRWTVRNRQLWFIFLFMLICTCILIIHYFSRESYVSIAIPFHFPERSYPYVPFTKLEDLTVSKDTWFVIGPTQNKSLIKDSCRLTKFGWNVVVLFNGTLDPHSGFPECVVLDDHGDEVLQSTSVTLPLKNTGYLYAIRHGARFIYETIENILPEDDKIPFSLSEYQSGLVYNNFNSNVLNPYNHFGQSSFRVPGYPSDVTENRLYDTYVVCRFRRPSLQVGIMNGYIDDKVGSIPSSHRVQLRHQAPPFLVPTGVFAPHIGLNILYSYDVFWGLGMRPGNIWKSYWMQRLMWMIDSNVGFYPSKESHYNPRGFGGPGKIIPNDTDKLLPLITNYTCNHESFFECAESLSVLMHKNGVFRDDDLSLVSAWFKALTSAGYKEPMIINAHSGLPCISEPHGVLFSPTPKKRVVQNRFHRLGAFCSEFLPWITEQEEPTFVFDNILLVVVFNLPYYGNIKLLEMLYMDHFPNMLYCGYVSPDWESLTSALESRFPDYNHRMTFINSTDTLGYFGYECTMRAIEINYQVDGFLVIGDDTLLNFWNLISGRFDRAWAQATNSCAHVGKDHKSKIMYWWNVPEIGKPKVNEALDDLLSLTRGSEEKISTYALKFFENRLSKGIDLVSVCLGDAYYVPRKWAEHFYYLIQVYRRHDVFLEMATPSVLDSLSLDKLVLLNGSDIWTMDRQTDPMKYYNSTENYLHPVKLGIMMDSPRFKKEYCEMYIKELLWNW